MHIEYDPKKEGHQKEWQLVVAAMNPGAGEFTLTIHNAKFFYTTLFRGLAQKLHTTFLKGVAFGLLAAAWVGVLAHYWR